MKEIVSVILSAIMASATCAAREPLEIKGDRIGETVAQFTAHHPNAKCKEESPDIRECYQRTGVTLADLTTLPSTCNPPTNLYWNGVCNTEGLVARFSKDKLKELTYRFYVNEAVSYAQSNTLEVCRAFTTKYGKPDDGDGIQTCDWDMKNEEEIEQYLFATTQHFKIAGKDAAFTTVMLSAISPSKDI
jgi:hypothetical protein